MLEPEPHAFYDELVSRLKYAANTAVHDALEAQLPEAIEQLVAGFEAARPTVPASTLQRQTWWCTVGGRVVRQTPFQVVKHHALKFKMYKQAADHRLSNLEDKVDLLLTRMNIESEQLAALGTAQAEYNYQLDRLDDATITLEKNANSFEVYLDETRKGFERVNEKVDQLAEDVDTKAMFALHGQALGELNGKIAKLTGDIELINSDLNTDLDKLEMKMLRTNRDLEAQRSDLETLQITSDLADEFWKKQCFKQDNDSKHLDELTRRVAKLADVSDVIVAKLAKHS